MSLFNIGDDLDEARTLSYQCSLIEGAVKVSGVNSYTNFCETLFRETSISRDLNFAKLKFRETLVSRDFNFAVFAAAR